MEPKPCSWTGAAMTLSSALAVVLTPSLGRASPFDHLKCYKIKSTPTIKATADLIAQKPQFPVEPGGKLTGPKLFCAPADKLNVQPPPPGAPPGPNPGDRLCYQLKCPETVLPRSLVVTDQFATFTVAVKKAFLVCTPAVKGVPTTTTTSTTQATSTTTTTTSTSTTPTLIALDHFRVYNAVNGPPGAPVTLKDQFHEELDIQLQPLALFLPPVDKNGGGIRDEVTHLACYPIPPPTTPFGPVS